MFSLIILLAFGYSLGDHKVRQGKIYTQFFTSHTSAKFKRFKPIVKLRTRVFYMQDYKIL